MMGQGLRWIIPTSISIWAGDQIVCPYCSTLFIHDANLRPDQTDPPYCLSSRRKPRRDERRRSQRAVAIAGAGIAGLSAAIALKLAGFPVEIFEREQNPQAIERASRSVPTPRASWRAGSFPLLGTSFEPGDRASQCAKRRAFEYGSASPGRPPGAMARLTSRFCARTCSLRFSAARRAWLRSRMPVRDGRG